MRTGGSSVATWWQVEDPTADTALLAADPGIGLWLIEEEGEVVGLIQAVEETEPQYRHAGATGRGMTACSWICSRTS